MANVNWGTHPLQTAFTAFTNAEWELWEPSFSSFRIRAQLPNDPMPCYAPRNVILNSTT